jgi:myo-inositol-1(or 4)-monophosphatase
MSWKPELFVALEAAEAAMEIIAGYEVSGPQQVVHKGRVDLVTEVDLACEQAIVDVLKRHTPHVPVLAEERGGASNRKTRWLVDPLDGTTNFVHGFPMYCTSIALEVDGEVVVGVVADPLRDRVYKARKGGGAFLDERRLAVSSCTSLDRALVGTGFAYDRQQEASFYLSYVEKVLQRAQGIRRAGSAAMDLVMVACGALDAYWEFNLHPWDVAAGQLLVTEAGGSVTAHDGGDLERDRPNPLATNGALHPVMLATLSD